MSRCFLDAFPVEILYAIFSYFLAHEILLTFSSASPFVDAALVTYSDYRIDFKSILKRHFDLVCRRIRPDQVVSLKLFDDDDTPCQIKIFLSQFQIEQFTRLRSLTLPDVQTSWLQHILSNLNKLERLNSLKLVNTPFSGRIYERSDCLINYTVENRLKCIPLSHLQQLTISNCSFHDLENIFTRALQLKSLNIQLTGAAASLKYFPVLPQLTSLMLKIDDENSAFVPTGNNLILSMNTFEFFLSKLPRLRHLVLDGQAHTSIIDGRRWEILAMDLLTFNFNFKLEINQIEQILETFRTPFWIERKRWFVAYIHGRLFSVPHFVGRCITLPFHTPVHSTTPNDELFYEHVDSLGLPNAEIDDVHRFAHVTTLRLELAIRLTTIQTMIDLSRVRELILYGRESLSIILQIPTVMPRVDKISLYFGISENINNDLRRIRDMQPIKQVRTLQIIGSKYMSYVRNMSSIKELCRIFTHVKQLHVFDQTSIRHIGCWIDGFKYLSNASFYLSLSMNETINHRLMRKPNMLVNGSCSLANGTFECRIIDLGERKAYCSIWIGDQASLSQY
ncbi:unnamed protein product [Rotaria socialis]|uniref:F-box domain-containing protein n=1 Tax=Rotaria socialis TaxID=392032 RepID=A0A817KRZ3_9BILA|nr:unnamed protein product [Rotaria socialis]CAF3448663.1 unnamed protein product [Rotaria socialis]CAF4193309.1 unnamed protein product [Rotaria socialis]CAF4396549.1 unnamed protein product [Rotaria socialis]